MPYERDLQCLGEANAHVGDQNLSYHSRRHSAVDASSPATWLVGHVQPVFSLLVPGRTGAPTPSVLAVSDEIGSSLAEGRSSTTTVTVCLAPRTRDALTAWPASSLTCMSVMNASAMTVVACAQAQRSST